VAGRPADPTATVTGGVTLTPPAAAKPGEKLELRKTASGSFEYKANTELYAGGHGAKGVDGKDEPALGYRASNNYANQARVVRGRAFYQNGNTWTDSTASTTKDMKRREVKFGSEEYFKLLAEHPEASAWLSLGNEVDVVIGEELVVVR
jgi:hypothetical protein